MLPPMKLARTALLDTLDRMQVMDAQQMEQYHSQGAPCSSELEWFDEASNECSACTEFCS